MHNFGDEFTIESYRIPWLIWIQVLVMFLLLLLFYCFSILVLDLSDNTTTPSSSTTSLVSNDTHIDNNPLHKHSITSTVSTNRLQNTQVREIIKGEIMTSTSRIMRGEDMVEMEASAASIHMYFHPCYYFRLASLAFLKCLGLDFTSESSSTPQRGKRKES